MTIEELEDKFRPLVYPYIGSSFLTGTESPEVIKMNTKECTKLSIEFTIKTLENLAIGKCYECDANIEIDNKIQELKQYLDERNTN